MNTILLIILLLLLLPVVGVYTIGGTLGILIKILFVVLLAAIILNLLPRDRTTRGRFW